MNCISTVENSGTCPIGTLSEGQLGACADICARDSECPSLQKCCSNGCGHVCITPENLPGKCDSLTHLTSSPIFHLYVPSLPPLSPHLDLDLVLDHLDLDLLDRNLDLDLHLL